MESVVDVLCVGDREERAAAVLNFHQAPLPRSRCCPRSVRPSTWQRMQVHYASLSIRERMALAKITGML